MAITLSSEFNKATGYTTVTARDAHGRYICCESWLGKGTRLTVLLSQQVKAAAEKELRRFTIGTGASVAETRQLSQRLG